MDHKDAVALLAQRGQEGREVELRQLLRRREQAVEVPPLPEDFS